MPANTYSNPVAELARRFEGWVAEYLRPGEALKRTWDFKPDEAMNFLSALEAGILEIDGRSASYRWRGLRGFSGQPVFLEREGSLQKIHEYRESVTQAAVVARLHLQYNWPMACLRVESGPPKWYFDVLVYERPDSDEVLMAVETKPDSASFELLLDQLPRCIELGAHERATCQSSEHGKYAGLVTIGPRYFLVVAPGRAQAFFLEQCPGALALTAVSYLPHYLGAGA